MAKSVTTYTDDGEAIEAWFAQTQREAEILRRHYEATGNPLFAWKAIRLFASRHAGRAFPRWVVAYLRDAATLLTELGEGIDFTKAPPPAPKGATHEQIIAAARKQQEFRDNRSLDWGNAGDRALKALKLAGTRKKLNRFTQYAEILDRQHKAQVTSSQREIHDAARKAGKATGTFIEQRTPPGGDQSGTRKKFKRNEDLLKLGEVSPDPFGPERARRITSLLGRKKGVNLSSE